MSALNLHESTEPVDGSARLTGSSTAEFLLFSLGTSEIFGISVFKVREITRTPRVTRAPNLPHGVEGVVSLRGRIMPVLSLSKLIGVGEAKSSNKTMLVTEFNGHVQGFLLHAIDRIARIDSERVRAPDAILGRANAYITAIAERDDGKLVSVLDAEGVIGCVYGENEVPEIEPLPQCNASIFFADDSSVARREIMRVLDKLQVKHQHAPNGREAWERLQVMAVRAEAEGEPLSRRIQLILTDAEMPEMDGYVLTRNLKSDSRFAGIPVVMHSSLSSQANRAMGQSVGVDAYVAKFDPRILAETIRPLIAKQAAPAASPEVTP